MSKTSVPQEDDEYQAGWSPGLGQGVSPFSIGGVPEGWQDADQRNGAQRLAIAERVGDERSGAPGLVSYKTSDSFTGFIAEEARLKRVRHGVMTSARLMEEQRAELQIGGFRLKAVFLTLTYRAGADWNPKDITGCLKAIRDYLQRRRVPLVYCWVAEIQERRAKWRPGETCLHYHVMLWLPFKMRLPMPDKRGWWPHGSTEIERARYPVSYLVKYASKGGCMDYVPSGARMVGGGGLSKERRAERAWWMCPAWLREKWGQEHRPKRAEGGGWVSRLTGEVIASPWRMVGIVQGVGWTYLSFKLAGAT